MSESLTVGNVIKSISNFFNGSPTIVKFKDGTYGIRVRPGYFGYEYTDLQNSCWTWDIDSMHFPDCKSPDLEKVKAHYKSVYGNPWKEESGLKDYGVPVRKCNAYVRL